MEHRVRVNILSGAVVVALGVAVSLITSTVVASRAYQSRVKQAAQAGQELTVKGSTRVRVRSDTGVWRIAVRGEGKELSAAFGVLEAGVGRVRAFLAAKGCTAPEISLAAIETTTFYTRDAQGRETREVAGHALERVFTVTSADVDRLAAAAGEVTELLREGVSVSSYRPQFYYGKATDLKIRLLGEATKDARTRADEIAAKAGCRVSEVRRAQMGVIQITEPNSTETSSGGMYDTSTIEKDVSVVVTLTLGVEN